jgi:FKBP-type peptidyl-prolyl cis-trans isomerase (trigger factor)
MTTNPQLKLNEDQSFVYSFTLGKTKILVEKQKVLLDIQKNFKTKGFRPGKVPLNIIEQQTATDELIEELISRLVSPLYAAQIKKDKLTPIVQPQIKFLNPPISLDKDWQFEISACQLPQIKLNKNYQSQIKNIKSKDDTDKMNQIVQTLIKASQVNFPQILIDIDVQKQLSSLVNQTQQAGLSIDQYFQSQKTNLEDYKNRLSQQIKDQWILNLALNKVAEDQKITVTKKDLKKTDPKNQQQSKNPYALHHLILQQKTLDFLKKL